MRGQQQIAAQARLVDGSDARLARGDEIARYRSCWEKELGWWPESGRHNKPASRSVRSPDHAGLDSDRCPARL